MVDLVGLQDRFSDTNC
uniref:Uncharacterized protein n=1 Tax=Arundo donax TaxID=35708 RepID=A0A0A9C254_ARUDO